MKPFNSKEIYIVGVGSDYIGSYWTNGVTDIVSYEKRGSFKDFCLGLKESFPDCKLRCIIDKDISEYIRRRMQQDAMIEQKLKIRGRDF